ncbi:MAG: nucleotidyltransferase family protein [Halofilum sp. (in: g-proteobacteria)]
MKAMILAAGRGERMRPLTDEQPKPLLHVGGRTLIDRHLEGLARAGFREVVINLAWLGHRIREHVGDGADWGLEVRYSDEGEHGLETAGGIVRALPLLGEAPFAVINADVYTDYPYERLAPPIDAQAHLVLVANPPQHPEGDFHFADGRVAPGGGERLTFSGIGVYHPRLFAGLPDGPAPLSPILRTAIARDAVSAEYYSGDWRDIGTPERLYELDRELRTKVQ